MYQQITLVGHLGNDPELKKTPQGVPVASFSLATGKSWVGQDGQKQEKTIWFRVSVWQKQAETVAQYIKKGSKVMVVGEMEDARAFTDRDGNQRASLEVRAQTVRFLDSKGDGNTGGNYAAPQPQQQSRPAQQSVQSEDVPF